MLKGILQYTIFLNFFFDRVVNLEIQYIPNKSILNLIFVLKTVFFEKMLGLRHYLEEDVLPNLMIYSAWSNQ